MEDCDLYIPKEMLMPGLHFTCHCNSNITETQNLTLAHYAPSIGVNNQISLPEVELSFF